jgi:hypothetical protein
MLLFRQINPNKLRNDRTPGTSNFEPEDERTLSTRREAITAQGAHEAHLEIGPSIGTWGVTVSEAYEVRHPTIDGELLSVYDDEAPAEPFHVSIHFPDILTRLQRKRIGKDLYDLAKQRGNDGWLYGPVEA